AQIEIDQIATVVGVPVDTIDERLTTVTANRMLADRGVRGPERRKVIDKIAAAVILQTWLDGRPESSC
ncbi:MAG TPA: Holliday junction resolvase RuvX, partial [Ilumatobacteraceae bacterium]|nr:Holliday junction resolvase RuvX [Ilumatobacteraceae bacterium]